MQRQFQYLAIALHQSTDGLWGCALPCDCFDFAFSSIWRRVMWSKITIQQEPVDRHYISNQSHMYQGHLHHDNSPEDNGNNCYIGSVHWIGKLHCREVWQPTIQSNQSKPHNTLLRKAYTCVLLVQLLMQLLVQLQASPYRQQHILIRGLLKYRCKLRYHALTTPLKLHLVWNLSVTMTNLPWEK